MNLTFLSIFGLCHELDFP